MAIASLILGVAGLTFAPLLGSILAMIFGYMARTHIRNNPHQETGQGIAMAGIVLGWIAVGLTVLAAVLVGGITICGICAAFGTAGWQ
jgi:membrane protein required for beta-lactamase induction